MKKFELNEKELEQVAGGKNSEYYAVQVMALDSAVIVTAKASITDLKILYNDGKREMILKHVPCMSVGEEASAVFGYNYDKASFFISCIADGVEQYYNVEF